MKYNNSLEYTDAINQLVKRNSDIIKLAKTESRELSDEESQEFDKNEEDIKELEDEKEELEKSLENPNCDDEKEEKKSNKNINVNTMETKNFSLVKEIRSSMESHKPIMLNRAAMTVAAEGEDVVATEVWKGSMAFTFIPRAFALAPTSLPTLPKAWMPRVFPWISLPVAGVNWPRLM